MSNVEKHAFFQFNVTKTLRRLCSVGPQTMLSELAELCKADLNSVASIGSEGLVA